MNIFGFASANLIISDRVTAENNSTKVSVSANGVFFITAPSNNTLNPNLSFVGALIMLIRQGKAYIPLKAEEFRK